MTDEALSQLYGVRNRPDKDPLANLGRFVELLRRRIQNRRQNIVIIDAADTGEGKSTLALQLCRGVNPGWTLADTAYSADQARLRYFGYEQTYTKAWRAGGALPPAALLWDEAVLGLISQGGRRSEELEKTIQLLSIIRVVGVSVFLCVPRIRMLDTFVREGLAEYWLMVTKRGEATARRSWKGAMHKRPNRLPYDTIGWVNPIGFRNMDPLTMTDEELLERPKDAELFRAYEEGKLSAVHDFLEQKPEVSPKYSTCPDCGLRSTNFNVQTHKCPNRVRKVAAA
jgi:hypothetical protein